MNKTKIICTIGPASKSVDILSELVDSGMNVARLNFSHGTYESHQEVIDNVKQVRKNKKKPIAIMLDTKGPEIRIGKFENNLNFLLEAGSQIIFTSEDVIGTKQRVSISYKNLWKELEVGQKILVDDGAITLMVKEIVNQDIVCETVVGGKLSSNKGVNIPYIHLNMPYMSEKDKNDILFGIKNEVEYIAASFVRSKEDVLILRDFLNNNGGERIKIISKIENLEGIDNFDSILEVSDGIMVARGDMGVEVPYAQIPGIQKRFIRKCNEWGKIVITATQMLESMTNNIMPTRAEITDVANAVFDGTSAVMLSGETTVGKHPVLVVKAMYKIVEQAEKDNMGVDVDRKYVKGDKPNAICDGACVIARDLGAKAIVAISKYGNTAILVAKYRPKQLIVGATPCRRTYQQLAMVWGINPILTSIQYTEEDLMKNTIEVLKEYGYAEKGDTVVVTAGLPLNESGSTNFLKVLEV